MRFLLMTICSLAFSGPAFSEDLSYGSRAGMAVTVVSRSGIDTKRAKINVKHTRQNAIAFCRDYVGSVTEECIAGELSVKLAKSISANCLTGEFTTLYGERVRFIGPNPTGDPEFTILGPNGALDGSSASGYGYDIEQFYALCPSRLVK